MTTDVDKVFELAKKERIGESWLGGWRRIEIWENERRLKTITVNGNNLVEMPKDEYELRRMLFID